VKSLLGTFILLSLVGCGRGFHAGAYGASNSNSAQSDSSGEAGDSVDAYYIDESQVEEVQLDLDLGDRTEPNPKEEQIELPLEPVDKPVDQKDPTPENKPEPKPEDKQVYEHRPDIETSVSDFGPSQTLKPTVYYLPTNDNNPFRACKSDDTRSFKAKKGQTLLSGKSEIKVCSKFYYAVQMQGSGLVRTHDDLQYLINYVGAQDGIPRFKIIDRDVCPYGLGMANKCLQPFISIAADPSKYKLGDIVYVDEVARARIKLPDGDMHQGFFIVTDTGAAIRGVGRFDFYTGPMHYSDPKNPFVQLNLQSKANRTGISFKLVKRGSQTEKQVREYYKGRQIIPYSK
jgi:hypothetical protein